MRSARPITLICVTVLASCDSTAPHPEQQRVRLARSAVDDQVAEIGEPITVSVRATDSRGKSVAGVTVLWEVEAGRGTVEPASVQTARNGIALAALRVDSGENRVIARVQGSDAKVAFVAHGCSKCGEWSTVPVDLAGGGRAWASAASIDGKVVVAGGEDRTETTDAISVFDPANATWRPAARLPARVSASIAAELDGRLYVIGGFNPESYPWQGRASVLAVDMSTGASTDKAVLNVGRFYAAGAPLDGKIYVVGGHAYCDFDWCSNGPLSSLEIYDPATDRWTKGPPMTFARAVASAAVLNGKLYVAGGTGGNLWWFDGPIASVEMFDPLVGRWVSRADLPVSAPVHLVVANGTMYAFAPILELQSTRTYAYDAERDRWTRLRDAPAMLYGAAVVAVDGAVYAIGGYSAATDRPFVRQVSNAVYVMRP